MDNAVRKTLNNILDYMGGCEDFRDNAQLRTYLEALTTQTEPVADVLCNGGLSDTELLDFLEYHNGKARYTGKCIFRLSVSGRGWRLHETSGEGACGSVREAIKAAIDGR